ncbi:MAG: hypothetical protein M3437_02355 [Chloroflexota bacterium]|nr:hypothetical protein [Chloroflexota bacterium]MDQ5865561.1 hypothetical protein [Chloroflexota bacterium]
MKRDPDFWFWVAIVAVLLALSAMDLAYEFNFFSEWFGWVFFVVVLLATVYTGWSLLIRQKSTGVAAPPVSVEQAQAARERERTGNILRFVCIGGIPILIFLTNNGVLPRSSIVAIPYIVLAGIWLWYELVGSKRENTGR